MPDACDFANSWLSPTIVDFTTLHVCLSETVCVFVQVGMCVCVCEDKGLGETGKECCVVKCIINVKLLIFLHQETI